MLAVALTTIYSKAFLTGLLWIFGGVLFFGGLFQPVNERGANFAIGMTVLPALFFFIVAALTYVFM